ncbi:terminase [Bacillus pseudomycoides]|uniref:Terminase n=1 Tax=Bacillus pseudomycoides TaxID=64104 RepID=A0A2B4NK06_9BACI|nr:phage terminase small subunit [Bacillus pseudomycoides]PEJ68736.1 terminase [Bacillus pseudomycoides]PEM73249.1 terminase [Bacillus pseudomycoides]PFW67982.1 terminase [Bacillus pseudomycoides]PFW79999.1 terminase [Bacillus pseudomycoides]PFZ48228.1 terminase [Bacillus pseudomycoides]
MARQRSPDRDKAFEIYKASKGEKPLVEIAEDLGISEGTVRGWKNKDKWNDKIYGTFRKNEKNAPDNTERSVKTGAPIGNKNAVGNKGGAPKGNSNAVGFGAPKQNANAVTHGLFRKIIPNDDQHAMELLDEIQNHTELDMLFNSIQLQYFNILNSQRIMHVRDKDDMSREVISESEAGESYTVQFAWDKQANLLTAYARAMTTLSSMIERFDKLANVDDERRLKLVQMKTNIEKTQADTDFAQERAAKLKGQKKDTSLLDALIEGRKQYEQNSD